ncbi:uncharacterized protein LOC120075114 isoform X2 [Benincasa hispida]|nr:uncharacterized protein LOC120075114 isoform X2 [Benincasa hispida]
MQRNLTSKSNPHNFSSHDADESKMKSVDRFSEIRHCPWRLKAELKLLEIQKELVSKNRKLKVLKQRKETLEDEVGFLRRRLWYLQKLQNRSHDLENLPMVLESKQNL